MKTILDACCGARKCWADKKNPNAVFMDIRKETCVLSDGRTIEINPDVVADFRHIPFPDNHFHLVLFDPPIIGGQATIVILQKIMGVCLPTGGNTLGMDSVSV